MRRLAASAPARRVATRSFQTGTKPKASGGYGDEPAYLHAEHMYDLPSMKNRKLKMGLLVFGGLGFGIAVPLFAVAVQQQKAKG
ncbi:hypothetical protein CBR_g3658 [Chara braunii]|uniref:Uncharacterized protein n=1 Tax=Chara braunii TaxID=69332 RepID=A0A388KG00_CHABU|nr:hypothetical protein CBR_g3658 [Chara braunii]|eukprot:GBG68959.1 hypothetical protein CBR_g3658 [Chara braunii]